MASVILLRLYVFNGLVFAKATDERLLPGGKMFLNSLLALFLFYPLHSLAVVFVLSLLGDRGAIPVAEVRPFPHKAVQIENLAVVRLRQ